MLNFLGKMVLWTAKNFHEYKIGQPFKIETYQTFLLFYHIKTFDFVFVVFTKHESFQSLSETYYLIKNKYKLLNSDPVKPEQKEGKMTENDKINELQFFELLLKKILCKTSWNRKIHRWLQFRNCYFSNTEDSLPVANAILLLHSYSMHQTTTQSIKVIP